MPIGQVTSIGKVFAQELTKADLLAQPHPARRPPALAVGMRPPVRGGGGESPAGGLGSPQSEAYSSHFESGNYSQAAPPHPLPPW